MTDRQPRLLFLGLDAMDPDLIAEWAKAGLLPAFASLFARGTFSHTLNPRGLYVGAVWPSFFTGVSPARHGRYCYEQIVTGSYEVKRFDPSHLKRSPFWNALSDAGRRVAIVDVPKAPLATEVNGIQLKDWGTHDPDFAVGFEAFPASLVPEVSAKFGSDPVGDCDLIERTASGYSTFCRNLITRIERKTAICRELLDREDWDLFLAIFAESHCVGHQCWTLHDTTHPFHDASLARAVGDPVKEVYVALDRALGELLGKAGPDTTVIVLASHGMGPHFDATFMLDKMLERLEPAPGRWERRVTTPLRGYWRRLLERARRLRGGTVPAVTPLAQPRCFAVPNNDVYGGIRVNLRGREPRGRIRPGRQYDALFTDLKRELMQLVNLDTGQPVVRDLLRSADLYQGEYLADLPDFLIEWNREAPISRISSARMGVLERRFPGLRNGDHKPEGFFWATGPDIPQGNRVAPVSVMDFAATLGALLDVDLPDVDGEPIPSLVAARPALGV